jgi:hypothetical protein
MTIALGKLAPVPALRSVWPHEASDFTPGLAEPDSLPAVGDEMGIPRKEVEILQSDLCHINPDCHQPMNIRLRFPSRVFRTRAAA